MASELTWSSQPPTEPGWYCYESPDGKSWRCFRVFGGYDGIPERLCVRLETLGVHPIEHFAGRWAGPIPEPKEGE